jgi:hypothetical protein
MGSFLQSPELRNVLGQPKRRIDPRQVIEKGQILIANLRKGRLGPEAANLIRPCCRPRQPDHIIEEVDRPG